MSEALIGIGLGLLLMIGGAYISIEVGNWGANGR